MKRFRLSTLMLLVVIAALFIGVVVQQRRAARREAELQARLKEADNKIFWLEHYKTLEQWRAAVANRSRSKRRPDGDQGVKKAAGRGVGRVGEGN
jgi:chromosome segregation ATPase